MFSLEILLQMPKHKASDPLFSLVVYVKSVYNDIGDWEYVVCSVPEAWSRAQTQHGARVVSSAILIKDDDVKVVGSQFPRATSLTALAD